jgi:hypothetical protein
LPFVVDASTVDDSWTTYTDPLGWSIDVPASWVVAPIDGSDGQLTYAGAVFGSAQPQPEPLTPTAFALPPGEVSLEVYNVSGGPYGCTQNDSAFPLSYQDFVLPPEADHAGDLYGTFVVEGCQFTLSAVAADATPEQIQILQQMVASIRVGTGPSQSPSDPTCAKPATAPTIVGQNITLAGCTSWTAGEPIDVRFEVRDAGIPMGLSLYAPSACDRNECAGKALWTGDLIVGRATTTYHLDPLDAGSYVLMDPVHPIARLEITVG